jgi:solute carrier family 6 GABA transporter-like protein 6/8/11/12/13
LVDALAVSTINGFTSILVGIFAFATIGNIASEHGTPIESVVSDGEYEILVYVPVEPAFLELIHFHWLH